MESNNVGWIIEKDVLDYTDNLVECLGSHNIPYSYFTYQDLVTSRLEKDDLTWIVDALQDSIHKEVGGSRVPSVAKKVEVIVIKEGTVNYVITIKAKAPTIGTSGNRGGVEHIFDVKAIDDVPNRLKEEIEFYKFIGFAIINISIKVDSMD